MEFNVNEYLRVCREQAAQCTTPFEKSAFVPKEDMVASLIKDLLVKLMAQPTAVNYKLTLSGPIVEQNKADKKQSFCSEFNQMIKNLIGLIGYEFSHFLMVHMGAIVLARKMTNDMKSATTYAELLQLLDCIYNTLKPFNGATFEFEVSPTPETRLCSAVLTDPVDALFDAERRSLNAAIASMNITRFHDDRKDLVNKIEELIDNIKQINRHINSIDKLVIMNMGKYTVLYDGSFIKIFEILYKSVHADNPRFNETNLSTINQFDVVERYINKTLQGSVRAESYIEYLNKYFNEIFYTTAQAMLEDDSIKDDVSKINIGLTAIITKSLAKITLTTLVKLAQLINKKNDSMRATSTPSRVQFAVVLEALHSLPPGIDCDYTLSQQYVLYYILSCEKVAKITKQKKEAREAKMAETKTKRKTRTTAAPKTKTTTKTTARSTASRKKVAPPPPPLESASSSLSISLSDSEPDTE